MQCGNFSGEVGGCQEKFLGLSAQQGRRKGRRMDHTEVRMGQSSDCFIYSFFCHIQLVLLNGTPNWLPRNPIHACDLSNSTARFKYKTISFLCILSLRSFNRRSRLAMLPQKRPPTVATCLQHWRFDFPGFHLRSSLIHLLEQCLPSTNGCCHPRVVST